MKYNIFAGCSFTWGQGLWYYYPTNEHIPTVKEYIFESCNIPQDALDFKNANIWPRKVCDSIGGEPLIKKYNGGTDFESIEFINGILKEKNPKDIGYVIFQTTQIYRSPFKFKMNGEWYHLRPSPAHKNLSKVDKLDPEKLDDTTQTHYSEEDVDIDIFYEWLYKNKVDIEEFEKYHAQSMLELIKETLKKCESLGIKTFILSWTDEYLDFIKKDEFFLERFINFKYKGVKYDCIDWMQMSNSELFINQDPTKLHDCGGDGHPSLKCHDIISKAVLNTINKPII